MGFCSCFFVKQFRQLEPLGPAVYENYLLGILKYSAQVEQLRPHTQSQAQTEAWEDRWIDPDECKGPEMLLR